MGKNSLPLLVFVLACCCTSPSFAGVSASYTATPQAGGGYLLDFTVANDIPSLLGHQVYCFGVDLLGSIQGVPVGWMEDTPWNFSPYGGSNTTYQLAWYSEGDNLVSAGSSLGGFTVVSQSTPLAVPWFALASSEFTNYAEYTAGDQSFFGGGKFNPGFEGFAAQSHVVPEPLSATLFLAGLGVLGFGVRRNK